MQLFSQKKAIFALSIAALTALGACGDDVTVEEVTPAVVISITPPSATMNIGESLNFAVQITGGSTTTPPTLTSCTSSNAAVATAAVNAGACRVTAVTAGNVTVTAAASTGNQAAAQVTVTAAQSAIRNLTVSPTTANMTTGQKVTITPNVEKGAAAVTVAYAYASSSTTVATVAANGEITAVAPGTATITTTATGSGTGFTTSSLTAATTVIVTAAPSGITSLTVQPASLTMAVGSTSTLVASAQQPSGAAAATITYGTNNPAAATVGANTGVVTAVGPGTAVITVTATSPANANFGASTVTQLVPVTVNPSANVTIHTINQGPIATSYYESFSSVQAGAQAATAAGYTYYGEAGIYEYANEQVNTPVDINNVRDQIQLVVNLQPNGQRVDSVVAYIADQATPNTRTAAARQIFSNGTANAEQITLFINTADFTANFAAGTATVLYPNGLKIVSVSVWTTDATGPKELGNASNNRQSLNFNNLDGYAASHTNPARVAQGDPSIPSKANFNWWGGPGTTGEGRSTIVPVFYTPGRTLRVMTVGVMEGANQNHPNNSFNVCGTYEFAGVANPTPSPLPHAVTYGAAPTATASISCLGYAHPPVTTSNFVGVVGAIDNYNNVAPLVTVQPGFRRSASVTRPVANRLDYEGPDTEFPDITRERPAVTGWVNASFNFASNTDPSDDNQGVGVKANSRSWMYQGCAATAPTAMSTATGADIPECPTDFLGGWIGSFPYTRGPYVVMYRELDRLDNPSQSDSSYQFGVDKTVPLIRWSAASQADTARRTTATTLANAWQAEFSDERSGFVDVSDYGAWVKNPATWTNSWVDVSQIYTNVTTGAQYAQDRSQQHFLSHGAGMLPAANYPTRAQCLVPSTSTADVWRLTNPLTSGNVFVNPAATFLSNPNCTSMGSQYVNARALQGGDLGDGYRPGHSVALPLEGIYRYETRVYDRAGNVSAALTRRMGNDLNPANFASLATPLSVSSGAAAQFPATFEDNTEVRAASLKLQYNSASGVTLATQAGNGATISIAGTDTLVYGQVVLDARFNDVINGPNSANLLLPMAAPTVTSIEFTNASGQIIANTANAGTKASAVAGTIWDWANRQDMQGAAGTPRVSTILGSGLADPQGFYNWTQSQTGLSFSAWTVLPGLAAGFNAGTGLKAQVTSTTNSINAPFARVDFYRRGSNGAACTPSTAVATATTSIYNCPANLYYLGSSTSAASSDQGTTRYWTYLAPTTQAGTYWMAETATAPVAAFDQIVAVGVRSTGEALATQAMTIAGTAITLTIVHTAPLTSTNYTPNIVFTQGSTTVATRTSAGTFAVPAGTTNITVNSVLVPTATCASGVATGTVTTPLSPNPVVAGPAASTVTVTYTCQP